MAWHVQIQRSLMYALKYDNIPTKLFSYDSLNAIIQDFKEALQCFELGMFWASKDPWIEILSKDYWPIKKPLHFFDLVAVLAGARPAQLRFFVPCKALRASSSKSHTTDNSFVHSGESYRAETKSRTHEWSAITTFVEYYNFFFALLALLCFALHYSQS